VLENTFIPEHYAVPMLEAQLGTVPGIDIPLYRLPIRPTLATMLLGTIVGMAERGLQLFIDKTRGFDILVRRLNLVAKAPPSVRVQRRLQRYGRLMQTFPRELRERLWTSDALHELGRLETAGHLLGPARAPGISGLQLTHAGTYLPNDPRFKAHHASMATPP